MTTNPVIEALESAIATAVGNQFNTVMFPISQAREFLTLARAQQAEREAMLEFIEAWRIWHDLVKTGQTFSDKTYNAFEAVLQAWQKLQSLMPKEGG